MVTLNALSYDDNGKLFYLEKINKKTTEMSSNYVEKDEAGCFFFKDGGVDKLRQIEKIVALNPSGNHLQNVNFMCYVCSHRMSGIWSCKRHWTSNKHVDNVEDFNKRRKFLRKIKPLSSTQEIILSKFLADSLQEVTLTAKNIVEREALCKRVETMLTSAGLEGVTCLLSGSSLTNLGFHDAGVDINVNFDLKVLNNPSITDTSSFLIYVYDLLKESELFTEVEELFYVKHPKIIFKDVKSGLQCYISTIFYTGYQTNFVIKKYVDMDERAKELCLLFRYWGKICCLDGQEKGRFPSIAFLLMAIHYLQQVEPPVLPVIKLLDAVAPDIEEGTIDEEVEIKHSISSSRKKTSKWKSENQDPIGKLFVGLFRYYLVDFHMKTMVVTIRQKTTMFRCIRMFGSKRIAVEDPYILRESVTNVITSQSVMDYFLRCMEQSYQHYSGLTASAVITKEKKLKKEKSGSKYSDNTDGKSLKKDLIVSSPGEEHGSAQDVVIESSEEVSDTNNFKNNHVNGTVNCNVKIENSVDLIEFPKEEQRMECSKLEDQRIGSSNDVATKVVDNVTCSEAEKQSVVTEVENVGIIKETTIETSNEDITTLTDNMKEININGKNQSDIAKYAPTFLVNNLTPRGKPPVICLLCSREGHSYRKCPQKEIQFEPLNAIAKQQVDLVTAVCEEIFDMSELKRDDFDRRLSVLQFLESHLKSYFNATCRLALFGSSVNGFGFKHSDMDICLRFDSDKAPKNLNSAEMVVLISNALSKHVSIRNVMYIKSAKVPIVKFKLSNLEGDICLYNCLALRNSAMLAMYAAIDQRVRILGYCMKTLAKTCQIGDASRGSLSSYSYILMVIYFLQHTDPPVIPVLQEMYDGKKPQVIVEDWNTWFFSDLISIPKAWSGFGKNDQSAGELWIGFLRFYVETFNFHKHVISVKQSGKLTKFKKGWNRSVIAIEDPFNLKHNTGGGININMFEYIISCFKQARRRFSEPIKAKLSPSLDILTYFFNAEELTSNKSAPKDRLCHNCNKIGHNAANCAEKAAEKRERRRRDSERETTDSSLDTPGKQQTDSSRNNQSSSTKESKSNGKSTNPYVKCLHCHKKGHIKRECPKMLQRKENRRQGNGRQDNGSHGNNRPGEENSTDNHKGKKDSTPKKNLPTSSVTHHAVSTNGLSDSPQASSYTVSNTPANTPSQKITTTDLSYNQHQQNDSSKTPAMAQLENQLQGYQFSQLSNQQMCFGSPSNVSFMHHPPPQASNQNSQHMIAPLMQPLMSLSMQGDLKFEFDAFSSNFLRHNPEKQQEQRHQSSSTYFSADFPVPTANMTPANTTKKVPFKGSSNATTNQSVLAQEDGMNGTPPKKPNTSVSGNGDVEKSSKKKRKSKASTNKPVLDNVSQTK